jgi:hypothetical protein
VRRWRERQRARALKAQATRREDGALASAACETAAA